MKKLKLILLITSLFFISSCAIVDLVWLRRYEDPVSQFVTAKNGREVAFIGQKYHYIFPDNSNLMKSLLFWRNHNILYIDPRLSHLRIDSENNIDGHIMIKTIFTELKPDDKAHLKALGFDRMENGYLSTIMKVHGKRYIADERNSELMLLNTSYNFKIYYSWGTKLGMPDLSPISITPDSIIWHGERASELSL
ncbi:MAG: hypothetical protein K0R25_1031 [Rickettsiaceae bacterium]|jgi:hypothetical protein|nr:hypothetical protein [Rickettsiaceae bacterium]